jgi:hypothetical protein
VVQFWFKKIQQSLSVGDATSVFFSQRVSGAPIGAPAKKHDLAAHIQQDTHIGDGVLVLIAFLEMALD